MSPALPIAVKQRGSWVPTDRELAWSRIRWKSRRVIWVQGIVPMIGMMWRLA